MKAVLIAAAVIAVLLAAGMIPIDVVVDLVYTADRKSGSIYIKIFKKRIPIGGKGKTKPKYAPYEDVDSEEKPEDKEPETLYERIARKLKLIKKLFGAVSKDVNRLIGYIFRRMVVMKRFDVSLEFGFDRAARTGITAGAANAFIYTLIGTLRCHMGLEDFSVNIQPDFDAERIDASLFCIIRTRIANIISVMIRAVKILLKALIVLAEERFDAKRKQKRKQKREG